jgi:hypothetical protein
MSNQGSRSGTSGGTGGAPTSGNPRQVTVSASGQSFADVNAEVQRQLTQKWITGQEEIRLIQRGGSSQQFGVRFYVTPELSESRTVNYQEISEIRQAGGILIYIGTQLRTYQINARMVSKTTEEADLTYTYTHRLKAWTTPSKDGGGGQVSGTGVGGANSPEILKLYGYGGESGGQLRGVPCVITSFNIDYPNNVSYIKTSNGRASVPIVQTFSIALKEVRSDNDLENFNIHSYRDGSLLNW